MDKIKARLKNSSGNTVAMPKCTKRKFNYDAIDDKEQNYGKNN